MTGNAQRLFRCDPGTGAVTLSALPPDIGRIVEPVTTVGGMLYGAPSASGPPRADAVPPRAGGTLQALDSDGDGLPKVWETA